MKVFFVLLIYLQLSCGMKKYLKEKNVKKMFVNEPFTSFGFAKGGKVIVDYKITNDNPDDSYLLLLVMPKGTYDIFYSGRGADWATCSFPSTFRERLPADGERHTLTYYVKQADQYAIILMECRHNRDSSTDYDITVETVNLDTNGDYTTQLSIEKVNEIYVSLGYAVAFGLVTAYVAWQCVTTDWQNIKTLHFCFLLVSVLFFSAYTANYHYLLDLNEDGSIDKGARYNISIMYHVTRIGFYTTLLGVAWGWQTLRNFVTPKELLFAALPVFFLAFTGFQDAACDMDYSKDDCRYISNLADVSRTVMLLSVLLVGNCTIRLLKTRTHHMGWSPTIPMQYVIYSKYEDLRIPVTLYVLLPVIFLIISISVLSWRLKWISILMLESTELLIWSTVVALFGPMDTTLITRAFDGSRGDMNLAFDNEGDFVEGD